VRGLQVHGSQVKRAHAGQRTAINLGGIDIAQIERGMLLAPVGRLRPTQVLDVQVDVLKSVARPLRSRVRVRVHLGAAEVLARVRVLEESGEIVPGKSGFAQLRLEAPIVALPQERFIIRSYSPQRTIAGGRILDPHATRHRGREATVARSRLETLAVADRATQLSLFVETAGERGLRRADVAARTGWTDEVLVDAVGQATKSGRVIDADGVYIGSDSFEGLSNAALAEVEAQHKREPLARGILRETLREQVFTDAAPEVFRAVMSHLESVGALRSEKEVVRAASHSLSLSSADAALRDGLEKIYSDAALEAPTFDEALARLDGASNSREHVRKIVQLLVDAGLLVRVNTDLFFHRAALDNLVASLGEYAAQHEPERLIDVPTFKEIAHISRKYAIPLLEYFDRERITRRAGDRRIILKS
jgi:selenocysteine-specific elongation factor